jgi:hypothetical protein
LIRILLAEVSATLPRSRAKLAAALPTVVEAVVEQAAARLVRLSD